jgi:ATP-dependent Lhr-like helicase
MAVGRGELETLIVPPAPLDVLAQQIVAEVSCGECTRMRICTQLPARLALRALSPADYTALVRMLAEGYTTRFGPRAALPAPGRGERQLRARRGARHDRADQRRHDPGHRRLPGGAGAGGHRRRHACNEDFAIESLAGDIFQLGNQSYRIRQVEPRPAAGRGCAGRLPPSIPFWLGEAPGRSDALSAGGLAPARGTAARNCRRKATASIRPALAGGRRPGIFRGSRAAVAADYCASSVAGFGLLPTQRTWSMERFFDEAGGTHLVIHAPFGSRINKAWGLALRKRFCRSFNFELQAAATDDAIVLSLSTSHSFPLADVAASCIRIPPATSWSRRCWMRRCSRRASAGTRPPRWRCRASVGGSKVAPQLQRMKSEDLLATVFPDQVACLENIVGDREVPDHPLVAQTLATACARRWMPTGWLAVLRGWRAADRHPRARPHRALALFAAEALNRRALCLPRRRAAGGAPHPGGAGAPLAMDAERPRPRPARSGGDRRRARGRLAAVRATRTRCTRR